MYAYICTVHTYISYNKIKLCLSISIIMQINKSFHSNGNKHVKCVYVCVYHGAYVVKYTQSRYVVCVMFG